MRGEWNEIADGLAMRSHRFCESAKDTIKCKGIWYNDLSQGSIGFIHPQWSSAILRLARLHVSSVTMGIF